MCAPTPQSLPHLPVCGRAPGTFEAALCLQQLRYSGVFEATAITRSGFPFRYSHQVT